MDELRRAIRDGSTQRTVAALSRADVEIDKTSPNGFTPLMLAAFFGQSRAAEVL